MKEVTKEEFKQTFLEHGPKSGWGLDYWNQFFENEKPGMRYVIEGPETSEHTRMMIVSNNKEHRLFFMTEESEESFFEFPDSD